MSEPFPAPSSRRRASASGAARPGAARLGALALAATLAAAVSGCGASAERAPKSGLIETATLQGAPRSIDPAYEVAAEDRAPIAAEPLSEFTRRAAEIAIREKKVYGAAAHLSSLYAENPGDKAIAFELARHMRYVGAVIDAERVLNDALAIHGPDPVLRLEQAKVFIAGGRAAEAVPILEALRAEKPDDPSILQAAAIAQDRLGEHDAAQAIYAEALAIGRPSAALLNNAGLSHLFSGRTAEAVALFRRAASAPGANAQVRMNLAMALDLMGETGEAKRVAESAAPEAVAAGAIELVEAIRQGLPSAAPITAPAAAPLAARPTTSRAAAATPPNLTGSAIRAARSAPPGVPNPTQAILAETDEAFPPLDPSPWHAAVGGDPQAETDDADDAPAADAWSIASGG